MSETDRVFTGEIPVFYDRYMGPLIFIDYAEDLAATSRCVAPGASARNRRGDRDRNPGIGAHSWPEAEITATDLNQTMLDFAAAQPGMERVSWRQADAQRLPFDDGSFDAVLCQFGVMFFPDRVAGYREARRVLRPGGQFLFSVWDRIAENEFSQIVTEAVAALFPEDPPQFLARTPHGYHDVAVIERELSRCWIYAHCYRDGGAAQPRSVTAGAGARPVLRQSVALGNRGSRRRPARSGDRCRNRCDCGPLWHGRGRRQDPGAYRYSFAHRGAR